MTGTIHVRREGEHVVLLEIDNPPRNTLGTAMRAKLREGLANLTVDLSVRAVVVMQISEISGQEGSNVRLEDLWVRPGFDAPLVWTGAQSRLQERFRLHDVDPSLLQPGREVAA